MSSTLPDAMALAHTSAHASARAQSDGLTPHTNALDDPVWASLTGAHAALALRSGRAARYLPDVGPLAGVAALDAGALGDLARLVPEGDYLALWERDDAVSDARWQVLQRIELIQMVCEQPVTPPDRELTLLETADVPEMLALVELTHPGPFGPRTLELGRYLGIRDGGRLVAMAGERLRPAGHAEVSGVCTAPEARGRGLAEALVRAVASQMQARGDLPFLHVQSGSASQSTSTALYARLGFRERRRATLAVLTRRVAS